MSRRVLSAAIVLVLLLFASMPILIVIIGGVAQALCGLAIIGCLAVLQVPLLLLLKRLMPAAIEEKDLAKEIIET